MGCSAAESRRTVLREEYGGRVRYWRIARIYQDEAGCSANEIAAWSGQSLREVERYTRAADQARLARNALARSADTTARRGIA
jgi:hypothetical protein